MKINNILDSIGNTNHVKVNKLFGDGVDVWMKLERSNPGGSIKDRIGLSMILEAENKGILKENSVIIEPTSGNTGIGLAMVVAVKGYRLILVMPESMSVERRRLISTYGAELVLTPKEKGMKGTVDRATELVSELENAWMPQQFENEANTEVHRQFTAQEIIKDFPEGIDYLITGVGTGGHITGCAQILKKEFPGLQVYAVEPDLSPVLSGGDPGPHPIQGIGAGFIPGILDRDILDGIIQVTKEEAFTYAKRCAKEEGILVGISSGASLAAVSQKIKDVPSGNRILTFCYDTGERYLSIEDLY
jgi:cysteine synthase A